MRFRHQTNSKLDLKKLLHDYEKLIIDSDIEEKLLAYVPNPTGQQCAINGIQYAWAV